LGDQEDDGHGRRQEGHPPRRPHQPQTPTASPPGQGAEDEPHRPPGDGVEEGRSGHEGTGGAEDNGSPGANGGGDARPTIDAPPRSDEASDDGGEGAASTPDPPAPWIWISDTGDNARRRSSLALYGFPEPRIEEGDPLRVVRVESFVTVRFRLEGGARDVEALVISPDGREAILFSKEPVGSQVFRLPLDGDRNEIIDARPIARLGFVGRITGAALSPDGRRLALRNELSITELVLPEAASLGEALAKELSPQPVRPPIELQGEAITYSRRGDAILTVSEGVAPWIHEIRRRKEPNPAPREGSAAEDPAPAR